MSTDYDSGVQVGFYLPEEDFLKIFAVKMPEKSHMEKRFDAKTGRKIKSEKVIDEEARTAYKFKDKIFEEDDAQELAEAIAADVGLVSGDFGDLQNGDPIFITFVVDMDSEPLLDEITPDVKDRLAAARVKLNKMGFKFSKPRIFAAWTIS